MTAEIPLLVVTEAIAIRMIIYDVISSNGIQHNLTSSLFFDVY